MADVITEVTEITGFSKSVWISQNSCSNATYAFHVSSSFSSDTNLNSKLVFQKGPTEGQEGPLKTAGVLSPFQRKALQAAEVARSLGKQT